MNPRNVSLLLVLLASLGACSSDSGSSTPPSNDNGDNGGVVNLDNDQGDGDQGSDDQGGDDQGGDDEGGDDQGGDDQGGDDQDNGDQACSDTADPDSFLVYQKQIDATHYNDFVYYNLNTHQIVALTAEQAAQSDQWHIAFRRYDFILNGGTSGPGNVAGGLADEQSDFYLTDGKPNSSVFLNATPASELGSLQNADVDLHTLELSEDSHVSGIDIPGTQNGTQLDMGWYFYDVASHQLSVNSDNWWLLRGGEGNTYARFHATSLAYDSLTGLTVTFAFEVQQAGQNSFVETAGFSASIPASGGTQCFDYNNNNIVACTGNQWDLQLEVSGRDFMLWTNSGLSGDGDGGGIGPNSTATMIGYPSGTTDIFGNDFSSYYESDKSAGIFMDKTWYAYSLQGNHKLWPNYRVYVVDTDNTDCESPVHKLQVISYYSGQGVSGHPNIRYQRVR